MLLCPSNIFCNFSNRADSVFSFIGLFRLRESLLLAVDPDDVVALVEGEGMGGLGEGEGVGVLVEVTVGGH